MINERYVKDYCCEDISLIENYALAIADTTLAWICHHILGEQYSQQYLKENGLYLNRPACELRFMTLVDHISLHHKGVQLSKTHKLKLSKKILQYTKSGEFIREWASAKEVNRVLGISRGNICSCCKGKRPYAGGYVWRYA